MMTVGGITALAMIASDSITSILSTPCYGQCPKLTGYYRKRLVLRRHRGFVPIALHRFRRRRTKLIQNGERGIARGGGGMTTLANYKRSEQLGLDELLAVIGQEEVEDLAIAGAADDPGRKPKAQRLTRENGTDPTIVPLFPGEHRPARRW